MQPLDVVFFFLIPAIIFIHIVIAPYTKVEESFNIQAIHDIAYSNGILHRGFDHLLFSGVVPRTFVGATVLAAICRPLIWIAGFRHAQFIARAALGLANALALLRYQNGIAENLGLGAARWYALLQASQFHVMYYASRPLPNMFAFALTTLAFRELLPTKSLMGENRTRLGISLLAVTGIIFRSEVALLLATEVTYLFLRGRISLKELTVTGSSSAALALLISIPIDSYYWQRPIWPELAGFYFNAIQGKSSEWGTSPYLYYFTSLLPRLLLNPLIILMLIPISIRLRSTRSRTFELITPSIFFIAIYSLQPHKESRFIIYVVPPLTAAGALGASYVWTRRSKGIMYRLGSLAILGSVLACFVASTTMLLVSSLNYPGGEALSQLHHYIENNDADIKDDGSSIRIHMDILSCMTGVTRFGEIPADPIAGKRLRHGARRFRNVTYDKTEDDRLLDPHFWNQFDYALMEDPGKAIGKWEIIGTVYAYAGMEVVRPEDPSSLFGDIERAYAANNITKEENGKQVALESGDVQGVAWSDLDPDSAPAGSKQTTLADLKARIAWETLNRFTIYTLVRDGVRLATGGWWVGPRMEPAIRILKRARNSVPHPAGI